MQDYCRDKLKSLHLMLYIYKQHINLTVYYLNRIDLTV